MLFLSGGGTGGDGNANIVRTLFNSKRYELKSPMCYTRITNFICSTGSGFRKLIKLLRFCVANLCTSPHTFAEQWLRIRILRTL